MTVYADVLFFADMSMDALALALCARVLGRKVRKRRLAAASLVGAAYTLFMLAVRASAAAVFASAVAVSVAMCALAFGFRPVSMLVKAVVLFYAFSMLLGGVMTFLYEKALALRDAPLLAGGVTPGLFAVFALCAFGFLTLAARVLRAGVFRKTAALRVSAISETADLTLLCDSGNTLYDPVSGLPTAVIRASALEKACKADGWTAFPDAPDASTAAALHFHYIPVDAVGFHGVLPAFIPRSAALENRPVNLCIAVDTNDTPCGGLDGLLPAVLIP